MNLFKSFTLKWWQASMFKLSMLSLGIALGTTWPEFFAGWLVLIWPVFLITASYVTYVWWKQEPLKG